MKNVIEKIQSKEIKGLGTILSKNDKSLTLVCEEEMLKNNCDEVLVEDVLAFNTITIKNGVLNIEMISPVLSLAENMNDLMVKRKMGPGFNSKPEINKINEEVDNMENKIDTVKEAEIVTESEEKEENEYSDSKIEDLVEIVEDMSSDYISERCMEIINEVDKLETGFIECLVGDTSKMLADGINCNMEKMNLNKCTLITNIGITIADVKINKDMYSLNDAMVDILVDHTPSDDSDEPKSISTTIGDLINKGLALWVEDETSLIELSPLEFRGITKLCNITEIDPNLSFNLNEMK